MYRFVAAALVLAVAGCGDDSTAGRPTTVYAATSLSHVLPQIARGARFSFGGSDTLALQIERGAPADLFLAASPKYPQELFAKGRCERPVAFATNRLVLIVRRGDPEHVRSVGGLRRGGLRLAVGSASVPIGAYTREVLAKLGATKVLDVNKVSTEENVGQVVSQVALGGADAGFVYVTDAKAQSARVEAIAIPPRAEPSVEYQGCVVKRDGADAPGARRVLERLASDPGQGRLEQAGFGLP
jgi:molybdate transport system substrate-binding protein